MKTQRILSYLSRLAWLLSVTCLVAGCGMPRDPEKTLSKVTGGEVRVGAVDHAPWVKVSSSGEVTGIEAQLVQEFADSLNAKIQWQSGPESQLVKALEDDKLDLVIGGFDKKTPWAKKVGITRPYAKTRPPGKTSGKLNRVLLTPQGENRWILTIDQHLSQKKERIAQLIPSSELLP